jgi:hypothetical protein
MKLGLLPHPIKPPGSLKFIETVMITDPKRTLTLYI